MKYFSLYVSCFQRLFDNMWPVGGYTPQENHKRKGPEDEISLAVSQLLSTSFWLCVAGRWMHSFDNLVNVAVQNMGINISKEYNKEDMIF